MCYSLLLREVIAISVLSSSPSGASGEHFGGVITPQTGQNWTKRLFYRIWISVGPLGSHSTPVKTLLPGEPELLDQIPA